MTAVMREGWTRAKQAACTHGLLAGLRVVQESIGPGVLPVGPRGHALVTGELAGTATRRGGVEVIREFPAGDGHLVALRVGRYPDTAELASSALAWMRFGLAERLFDQCVAYLAGRMAGEQRLIDLQLIRGDLGEITLELLEIEGLLGDGAPAHVHRRLTTVDRLSLRLLGASGFLADGPGQEAYLSELLADTYVDLGDG